MAIAMEDTVNPMQYTKVFKVTPEMIDDNHHFNNVWSVKWIQDIAIAHSDSVGGTQLMKSVGAGWMIHVQHIEYKSQAFLNDEIRGTTWVAAYGKGGSPLTARSRASASAALSASPTARLFSSPRRSGFWST